MAKNGPEPVVKKNSKLEIFLKRNLDVDTFEKVRAHDSCIVCSEKEEKAFKYVILTDEWIYLTENPPKKLYETVRLKDLVSIELLNDFPTFLQGEERDNTQHLVIRYLTDDVDKPPKSARREKGADERATSPGPETPRSSLNPIILSYGRRSFSARETKENKLLTARQILADGRLCHTERSVSLTSLSDTGSRHVQFGGMTSGHASPRLNGMPRPISPILKRTKSPSPTDGSGTDDKPKSRKAKVKKSDSDSPRSLPSPRLTVSGSRSLPSPRSSADSRLTPRIKGELRLDLSNLRGSDEDYESDASLDSAPSSSRSGVPVVKSNQGSLCGGTGKTALQSKPADDEEFIITLRDGSIISLDYLMPKIIVSETASPDHGTETVAVAAREAVLHLYIMSKTSKFLMLTRTAWHSYILRATNEEDPAFVVRTTVIAPKSAQPPSEKLELLFRQLKTEMQYSTNTMEDIFYHIHELKVAADRNFALRKLFWKTPEVFRFLIHQLRLYVPMTPIRYKHGPSQDEVNVVRADELEFLNLILETIAILFRETEIVATRVHMMKSEGGRWTQDLVNQLMASPEVPDSMQRLSLSRTGRDLDTLAPEEDAEILRLVDEYRDLSTRVLFELLMIGEQAAWCNNESSILNVSWIVKAMYSAENVEALVEHMITKAMSVISPRRADAVSPAEAVLLYHQFHVIRKLVDFNDNVITFIQNNFFEEFKYYVQGPVLRSKLPSSYLLRPYIFTLMENVISKVLEKRVVLSEGESGERWTAATRHQTSTVGSQGTQVMIRLI